MAAEDCLVQMEDEIIICEAADLPHSLFMHERPVSIRELVCESSDVLFRPDSFRAVLTGIYTRYVHEQEVVKSTQHPNHARREVLDTDSGAIIT